MSQSSALPAAAAITGSHGHLRISASSVAASRAASKRSNPAHARSQWCVTCSPGRLVLR
jgi:hypothetical protein